MYKKDINIPGKKFFKRINLIYLIICIVFLIFSWGFVDLNMPLPTNGLLSIGINILREFETHFRIYSALLFIAMLAGLSECYLYSLSKVDIYIFNFDKLKTIFLTIILLLFFSFPALTYDLFNYIETAKVAFTYHENPYVTMPIEIPNDPNLAFTRAANKVALYGPVWIILTAIPHYLGFGNLYLTIFAFKALMTFGYIASLILIYKITRDWRNVVFFGLNPLIVIETLISGHNDIVMMVLVLLALLFFSYRIYLHRIIGWIFLIGSVLVKGSTIVLLPVYIIKRFNEENKLLLSFVFLFLVFILIAPLREELYPWYSVWWITLVAILPYKKYRFVFWFSIITSISLELRHVPYMITGIYEGWGPLTRTLVSVIPPGIYSVYYLFHFRKDIYHEDK
jgi:hypothetical protein